MRLSGQLQVSFFKFLSVQKAPKSQTNNLHPLTSFYGRKKTVDFVAFCSLVFVLLVCFDKHLLF